MHDFFVKWGIFEGKMGEFCLKGAFSKRKWRIFAYMRDFWDKWEIFEEKMHDLPLNGGIFEEKMADFRVKWGIFVKKMGDFWDKCWIFEEKMHDLPVNGRLSRRKSVIFAEMGHFRRENVWFSLKCMVFLLNGGFLRRKCMIYP